jgi:hypothetical protein
MPNNFPDWSGTWTNVKGFAGKTPWFTENWSALVDRTEDIAQVIDTATAGYTTLNDRLNDFTTVADVEAIVGGGGTPSNIPITSLGVGTAIANQKIKVNPSGTGIIGVNDVNDITELSVGTATADQLIRVNPGGTAIIGEDQSNLGVTDFGVGSATPEQLIRVNSAGNGIEGISPVIFVGGIPSDVTVWNQTSTNGDLIATVDKTSLFTSRYTNNCSYISDGTNDVVQITEIGYFRVVFTGSYIFNALYSSSGVYSFNLRPYLLDTTSKAVIVPSTDELFDIRRYFGTTNTNAVYITESFSMERIYYNSSGTLNVGAYIWCNISTTNASSRGFFIYYPRLIVTQL